MNGAADTRKSIIRDAIEHAQRDTHLAGLAVAVAYGNGSVETIAIGTDEKGNLLTSDSLFPIASITKLAVALAILRLSDQDLLSVNDPLARFVPNAAAAHYGITLQQLMTHTAGLSDAPEDPWTYDEKLNWRILAEACMQITPTTSPGTRVAYSNMHYGLLAIVIEQLTGQEFPDALEQLVIRPLAIEAYLGIEPPRTPAIVIDTADPHAGTTLEAWNTPFWRSLGQPWSGMVTTPVGALGLLRAYFGVPETFLRPETRAAATHDQTGGLGGGFPWQEWDRCPWGLGPMIIAQQMNHWLLPTANPGTLCHGGYSGCAVFTDPTASVAWSIHGTRTAADDWFPSAFPLISAAVLTSAS
jgi:CubicO group peptidase (beta-lactamase class C family)